ncbi:MAG: hypothetical protein COB30_003015 [Ectothiorhodospiraceae bacterium]|nr:hypothetical protein [Ectothiorhodospiraceae bacterium]MBN4053062.1 hypothetical protein [Gammaproteobacteria bacterium AH-315-K14]
MFKPKSFGWRCSVFDFSLGGQIVEYYHSFSEFFLINDKYAHRIYEKWRNCDENETAAKSKELRKDLEESTNAFDEEWEKVLSRLDLTENQAKNNWSIMAMSILQTIKRAPSR